MAVLVGLTQTEERDVLAHLAPGKAPIEDERVEFVVASDGEDGVTAMNIVQL